NPDYAPVITHVDNAAIVPLQNQPPGTNLLGNPGFENGFSSWSFGSGLGEIGAPFPHNGSNSALFVSSGTPSYTLTQSFTTIPGLHYTVDFFLANYDSSSTGDNVGVSWNGASIASLTNVQATNFQVAYTEYHYDVLATGSSSTLQFTFQHPT